MTSSWWSEFGFIENPYDTKALFSDKGDQLIVGRDDAINDLINRLYSRNQVPLICGENGVGKTSIVNVASYRMCVSRGFGLPRFFALDSTITQASNLYDMKQFEQSVWRGIADVLSDDEDYLNANGIKKSQINTVRKTLGKQKRRFINLGGIGIPTPLGSVEIGTNQAADSSTDYELKLTMQDWLSKCFGKSEGGVICMIDNLELVDAPSRVRQILEHLRDTLFCIEGLIWVLCGTPDSVGRALSSSRLTGYIREIEIKHVDKVFAPTLVRHRIEQFKKPNADPPVDEEGFAHIYEAMNYQLRSALDLCVQFSEWLVRYPERRSKDHFEQLKVWLNHEAAGIYDKLRHVSERSWEIFDRIAALGTDIRSANPRVVNMDTKEQLEEITQTFVDQGVFDRIEIDDNTFTIKVTQNGWLIKYLRKNTYLS